MLHKDYLIASQVNTKLKHFQDKISEFYGNYQDLRVSLMLQLV